MVLYMLICISELNWFQNKIYNLQYTLFYYCPLIWTNERLMLLFQVEILVFRRKSSVRSTLDVGYARQFESTELERQCTREFAAGHCQS